MAYTDVRAGVGDITIDADEGVTPRGPRAVPLSAAEALFWPPVLSCRRPPTPTPRWGLGRLSRASAPTAFCVSQIVLLKDQRKCFSIDNPGYEPEVVAVHPGGETVAVGGAVRPCPHTLCPGVFE